MDTIGLECKSLGWWIMGLMDPENQSNSAGTNQRVDSVGTSNANGRIGYSRDD